MPKPINQKKRETKRKQAKTTEARRHRSQETTEAKKPKAKKEPRTKNQQEPATTKNQQEPRTSKNQEPRTKNQQEPARTKNQQEPRTSKNQEPARTKNQEPGKRKTKNQAPRDPEETTTQHLERVRKRSVGRVLKRSFSAFENELFPRSKTRRFPHPQGTVAEDLANALPWSSGDLQTDKTAGTCSNDFKCLTNAHSAWISWSNLEVSQECHGTHGTSLSCSPYQSGHAAFNDRSRHPRWSDQDLAGRTHLIWQDLRCEIGSTSMDWLWIAINLHCIHLIPFVSVWIS